MSKNILITPSPTGYNPTINFSGDTANIINLEVLPDGNVQFKTPSDDLILDINDVSVIVGNDLSVYVDINISGTTNLQNVSVATLSADTIYTHTISGMSPVNINDVIVENGTLLATSMTGNTLIVNNNVGIGTTNPSYKLDVKGTTSTSGIRSDIGYDINPVLAPTTNPTFTISAGAGLEIGQYYYAISYYTTIGETNLNVEMNGGITSAGTQQITLTNIPISSDYRVIGKRIYRGKVGQRYNCYLVATISNDATTYVDYTPDASLGTTNKYYQNNTTTYMISVNGLRSMILDKNTTAFGFVAGGNITTGGRNALFGSYAGSSITAGLSNVLIGHSAGSAITTGSGNIALGEYTCRGAANSSNICIGGYTGYYGASITGNILIGPQAGYKLNNSNYNVFMGFNSGFNSATNSYSIFIGNASGKYETGSQKLIIDSIDRTTEALGRTSALIYGVFSSTPANQILSLGGGGNVGIGTNTPYAKLDVNGNVIISGKTQITSSVQIGDDTTGASSINAGAIRYRSDSNNSYCEMVMQTGSTEYGWVIIKQNTW